MAVYRLTDRKFSRLWRRSKDYSDHEIRYLVKKRGLALTDHKSMLTVTDPKTRKVVATFQEVPQIQPHEVSERSQTFAALRL